MTEKFTLADLLAYANCPYEHFWRRVAKITPAPSARGFVEYTVHKGVLLYYGEFKGNMVQSVGQIWQEKLEEWKCVDDTWDLMVRFAAVRARVLEPFLSGKVLKQSGERYKVPTMSREYKRRAADAGLPRLASILDERLGQVVAVYEEENYGLLDAFCESIAIAQHNAWPALDGIVGVDVPFEVHLTDELTLDGVADLVVQAEKGCVVIEVHDYSPVRLPTMVIRRDLRVVASLYALGEWSEVHHVVFRHLRSGATVSVSRLPGTGRLLTAAISAASGIRHRVYVPRLVTQSRQCLTCQFFPLCLTAGRDVLDVLDPTLLAEIEVT